MKDTKRNEPSGVGGCWLKVGQGDQMSQGRKGEAGPHQVGSAGSGIEDGGLG